MDKKIVLSTIIALTTGCSTATKSTFLGAGIGGAVGGLVGSAAGAGQSSSTMTGAAVGAAVGGLIGYSAHKQKEKNELPVKLDLVRKSPEIPGLTSPKVNCYTTEDRIDENGKRWEQGHIICNIEKQSTWSR